MIYESNELSDKIVYQFDESHKVCFILFVNRWISMSKIMERGEA